MSSSWETSSTSLEPNLSSWSTKVSTLIFFYEIIQVIKMLDLKQNKTKLKKDTKFIRKKCKLFSFLELNYSFRELNLRIFPPKWETLEYTLNTERTRCIGSVSHWVCVLFGNWIVLTNYLLARKSIKGLFVHCDFKFLPNDKIIWNKREQPN